MNKFILASKSPRRIELLRQIGYRPEVIPSTVDEKITKKIPHEIVEELAEQKAADVANQCGRHAVILGADTIVSAEGTVLGKPKTQEHAFEMLRFLSGRVHQVYTGVAFIETDGTQIRRKEVFSVCTDVHVEELSDDEIIAYIATGEPMDKAGSYGIQGIFARHIGKIDGDYPNVVGLPIQRVYQTLTDWGIDPEF